MVVCVGAHSVRPRFSPCRQSVECGRTLFAPTKDTSDNKHYAKMHRRYFPGRYSMKTILRKISPLSPFVVAVGFYIYARLSSACSTCLADGRWLSCSDGGYAVFVFLFTLLPIAALISATWYLLLYLLKRRQKRKNAKMWQAKGER